MSDQHEERKTLEQLEQEARERESLRYNGEAIALGEDAKMFLTSDLAQCITDIAEQRVTEAMNELATVDPDDVKAIVKLQNEIKVFKFFDSTLHDIVAAGDYAYQVYQAEVEN